VFEVRRRFVVVVCEDEGNEGKIQCEKHLSGKRFFHSGFLRMFEPESSARG
jgi:hypothetical protein